VVVVVVVEEENWVVRLFDSYRGTIARTWNLKESLEKKERDSSAKYLS